MCGTSPAWRLRWRPQAGYYADLIAEAAALWESLAQNHPFIDGNKRLAFAVTYTFLTVNGARITANADEIYAFVAESYADGSFRFREIEAWLMANVALALAR